MAIPLDQQFKIEKKGFMEQRIPVLHESGIQRHYFVSYVPAPTDDKDQSAIEQWIERMTFIIEDLTWLLQQNHTQFWCEVTFNTDFRSLFDSYLRYAPRVQHSIPSPNYFFISNGKQLEEKVSRLMFMCILRLSTHKESSEHFFTTQGFGDTIYAHYIFDIPRLFDICALYAANNKELLSKMIGNIFKQQTKYCDDLKSAIHSIKNVINDMMKNFHTQTGPRKAQPTSKSSSMSDIVDVLYYILDLSCTINRFFAVYPQGRTIFFHENFQFTLIELFETFLRAYERTTSQLEETPIDIEIFEETKYETASLIHDLISSCCVDPLMTNDDKSEHAESLLKICSLFMTEKRCLAAYEDYFNLFELVDLVHQATKFLNEKEMTYYKDGVQQAIETYGTPWCKRKLTSSVSNASVSNKVQRKDSSNPNIKTIQSLFPHLNEKYLEICLKHYNNDTDRLVNALFDNTVPQHLQRETIAEPSATSVEIDDKSSKISLVEQRANNDGDDQFSIFNRENIALGIIHRGKKTRDDPADLNDKSHLADMNERYARLALVEDTTDGEYDDEYDDTYDDGTVNVDDKDDTIDKELPKNENRLVGIQPRHYRHIIDDDEEESEEQNASANKRHAQFVENPEVVRERRAQQRAAWQQRHQPNRSQQTTEHDVVGNVRGRGQPVTVTHNRRWKDTHKASRANHNRRDRAAQKSNRGLLS